MSRTYRGDKGPGYDYWGSRHSKLTTPGRFTKTQTHRQERRISNQEVEDYIQQCEQDSLEDLRDIEIEAMQHYLNEAKNE